MDWPEGISQCCAYPVGYPVNNLVRISPDISQIREVMRGKEEQVPRRERARARDHADRSDYTASRACRCDVSAEQIAKDGLFLPQSALIQSLMFVRQKPVRDAG